MGVGMHVKIGCLLQACCMLQMMHCLGLTQLLSSSNSTDREFDSSVLTHYLEYTWDFCHVHLVQGETISITHMSQSVLCHFGD